jgi:hypothetical protein
MKNVLTLGFLSFAVAFSGIARGQANVNESLETAFVYVDANTGSDSNPGTQALPFKTVGKAASVAIFNNQHGIGTRVTINPAIYREALQLTKTSTTTSLPITFQAATKGQVEISGADVWTGWQTYAGNPNIFTHAWPYVWGQCPRAATGPTEQAINLRRETIFVNQALLTQVLTSSQLTPGTFFVDETNAIVYIYPAIGININAANVEVGTRNRLFISNGLTNLVLRGLRFEKGNDCRDNDTVQFNGGNNILIDADGFNWNNAGAFGVNGATSFTVRNSLAMHNGQRGFKSYQAKHGAWAADEADYNNWRGAQGGIYGWAGGGFYFFSQHNNAVANLKMLFNMSHGVHWDTDNANDTAVSLIASSNLLDGLVVEKSEGPILITKSHVCFNAPIGLYYDGGLALRASTFVTLTGNSIANNYVAQIPLIGIQGGVPMPVTNYETGQQYQLLTTNLSMRGNVVQGVDVQQLFDDFDQSGAAWTGFQSTLASDRNTWWSASVAQPFTVPVPNYFTLLDWTNWLSVTGQDAHSTFTAPTVDPTIPCQVAPDATDYWFVDFDNGALPVVAGYAAKYTLLLLPLGGFNGQTFFTSSGVASIPGASLSWSAKSLTGSGSVTFVVKTSSTTPKGSYPVTLAAQSGNLTRTVTVFLNVQ